MPLDDLTLMFTLSLAALCGAATVGVAANMSKSVRGTKHWAVGLMLIGFAFGLNIVFPTGGVWKSLAYNLLLLAGHSFWLTGTWRYLRLSKPRNILFASFLIIAIPICYFTLVEYQREVRVIIIGFWLIFIRIANAFILLQKTKNKPNEYKAAWGFVVLATIEVTATALYSYSTVFGHVPFIGQQSGTLAILTWLGALLGILLGVPLLMLLATGRLITKLEESANTDLLTGLLNRRGFFNAAGPLIAKHTRDKKTVSVMMVDVDHFKKVNDTHGHAIGDDVLRIFGECVNGAFRDEDIASRWGGEEVCILLANQQRQQLENIANRLRECVTVSSESISQLKNPITLSIGIAIGDPEKEDFDGIQRRADTALYKAKAAGRDRIVFAELD